MASSCLCNTYSRQILYCTPSATGLAGKAAQNPEPSQSPVNQPETRTQAVHATDWKDPILLVVCAHQIDAGSFACCSAQALALSMQDMEAPTAEFPRDTHEINEHEQRAADQVFGSMCQEDVDDPQDPEDHERVQDAEDVEDVEDADDADDAEDAEEAEDEDEDAEIALDQDGAAHSSEQGIGEGCSSHLAMGKWRLPNLRVLNLHVAFNKISVILPADTKECKEVILEMLNLNLTLEGLMQLPVPERLCLKKLGVLKCSEAHEIVEAPGMSGSCAVTLCSFELFLVQEDRHSLVRLCPQALWAASLRLVGEKAPVSLNAEACVHGLELCPYPAALESLGCVLTIFQEASEALESVFMPDYSDALPKSECTDMDCLSLSSQAVLHLDLVLRDVVVDLSLMAPVPLRPLRLVLPRVEARVVGSLPSPGSHPDQPIRSCHLHPPHPPPWHVSSLAKGAKADPDWHVYGCLCGRCDEAESRSISSWELLVTERQWQSIKPDHHDHSARPPDSRRVLLRQTEILRLSASKLQAFEQMQLQDKLAEEQHARSTASVIREKVHRFPEMVELFEGNPEIFESELEAQLENLRVELRALDVTRREDEQEMRNREREASSRLATARAGAREQREQELQQQLEEEQRISAALRKLVAAQEAILKEFSEG